MAVDDYGIEVLKKSGAPIDGASQSNYIVQTKLFDKKGNEITTNDNQLNVVVTPDRSNNSIQLTKKTVTTLSSIITFPDSIYRFQIFHQTYGDLIYFGDSSVDTTYPSLAANDVLEVEGEDLEIYVLSSSASTTLFIQNMELT